MIIAGAGAAGVFAGGMVVGAVNSYMNKDKDQKIEELNKQILGLKDELSKLTELKSNLDTQSKEQVTELKKLYKTIQALEQNNTLLTGDLAELHDLPNQVSILINDLKLAADEEAEKKTDSEKKYIARINELEMQAKNINLNFNKVLAEITNSAANTASIHEKTQKKIIKQIKRNNEDNKRNAEAIGNIASQVSESNQYMKMLFEQNQHFMSMLVQNQKFKAHRPISNKKFSQLPSNTIEIIPNNKPKQLQLTSAPETSTSKNLDNNQLMELQLIGTSETSASNNLSNNSSIEIQSEEQTENMFNNQFLQLIQEPSETEEITDNLAFPGNINQFDRFLSNPIFNDDENEEDNDSISISDSASSLSSDSLDVSEFLSESEFLGDSAIYGNDSDSDSEDDVPATSRSQQFSHTDSFGFGYLA